MTLRYKGKSHTGFNLLVVLFLVVALVVSVALFVHAGSSRGMVTSKAVKHGLTTLSALLGVVLTIGQAIKSFQKARDHGDASATPDNRAEVETNGYNYQHFWRVGALWVVGAVAAAATVVAEIVDFYNDGLTW